MKKRILRDPGTGEIVGATRAPFLKAKLEAKFSEKKVQTDESIPSEDLKIGSNSQNSYLGKMLGLVVAFILGIIATQFFKFFVD